jgi:hypothetical protein
MRNLRVDYAPLERFGVELDCISEVAATTVAMDNGFTALYTAPTTITSPDVFAGRWLFTHTAVADQLMAVYTTNEIFQFVAGHPMWFHGRLLLGPTTPEEINAFLGCMNAFATAPVVNAGAGPKATGDHFGFYTPEAGGAVYAAADDDMWMAVSQHNGVRLETILNAANSLDGQDHRAYVAGPGAGIETDLEAQFMPTNLVSGVAGVAATIFDAEISFWVNNVLVAKHQHRGVQQITIANTTLMNFGFAMQNTAAASTALLSRMGCHQLYDARE